MEKKAEKIEIVKEEVGSRYLGLPDSIISNGWWF